MNKLEALALQILRDCLGEETEIRSQEIQLPGTPDFFIPSVNLALYIDGAYWHGGEGGRMSRVSLRFLVKGDGERADFWQAKVRENLRRDREVNRALRDMGIKYVRLKENKLRAHPARAREYVSRCLALALFKGRKLRGKRALGG